MSRLPALALASAAAATAAANQVYYFATGRDAVLDLRDKLRLGSRRLPAWDRWCAANPRRADIVVCLTTTPSRTRRLPTTFKTTGWPQHDSTPPSPDLTPAPSALADLALRRH